MIRRTTLQAGKLLAGYVLLVEVGLQLFFGKVPLLGVGLGDSSIPHGVFALGAVIGCVYALVAFGIILIYRASRAINFAQAALGSVPAVLGLTLVSGRGWPFFAGLAVALVVAAGLGATVEVAIVRRFRTSPRLVFSVATIGLALLLSFFEFYVPRGVSGSLVQTINVTSPLLRGGFHIGFVLIDGDAILTAAAVLLALLALGFVSRRTAVGLAIRAYAENSERVALLGIRVQRLGTIVWAAAAVLSALGVFLQSAVVGLPIGSLVGPGVLLFGLAAAVLARMEHFPAALAAGVGLGILQQTAVFASRDGSIAWAAVLVVVLAGLLLRRRGKERALQTEATSFETVDDVRPVPLELRKLPGVRWARFALFAVASALAVAAPWIVSESRRGLETRLVIFAMIGVSLVILTGWTGQISLGQFGFAGVGAAVAGALATRFGADFFVTLAVAGVAGAVAAVLIGLPALRFRGWLLAVTTLGFAFTVQNILLNRRFTSWLLPPEGTFVERPRLYGFWSTASDTRYYFVVLATFVLTLLFARSLRTYRGGRILLAARDNERVTHALGISVARARLVAFAVSGFIAAMAGALLAFQRGSVEASGFEPLVSLNVFAMTVIGGASSLLGAVLGAFYVLGLPLLPGLSHIEQVELLTTSVGLLYLLVYLPGGLAQATTRVRDAYLRRLANRNGIRVPSLIADGPKETVDVPRHAQRRRTRPAALPADGLPYDRYVRAEGLAWLGIGLAWTIAAWPGLVLDYPNPGRGVLFVPLVIGIVAVLAWRRHGASLRRPGTWFLAGALANASPFRPHAQARRVFVSLAVEAASWAAIGPVWVWISAWRDLKPEHAQAVLTFGPGLALVVVGIAMAMAAPRAVRSDGATYLVAAPGRLAVRPPRLSLRGGDADVALEAELASGHLLSCRDLDVCYGQVQVLFGCDVNVRPGEILALLGTNGAGKSTLLRAICGLTPPVRGAVLLEGRDIAHDDPSETTRSGVTLMPGGRSIFPSLTVNEHMRLAAWAQRRERGPAIDAGLEHFPPLRSLGDRRAGDLSGGEQQMLALATALAVRPRLLLVDELSLGLAPSVVERLLTTIRRAREEGTTVVIVEQSLNVALTIADRAYFMEKGQVRFAGSCAQLLKRNDVVRSVFLSGNGSRKVSRTARRTGSSEPLLEVRDVHRSFGGIAAVSDLSLGVGRREIVGIIGPNGAGKTTLFDLISGFLKADAGRIRFDGTDVTNAGPATRSRLGMGRSFQDARLVPSLTVAENLALGLDRHLAVRDLVAGGFALPDLVSQEEDVAWSVADLVDLVNLGDFRDKLVRELSAGTRRIVDLGMMMAHDPQLLLLDEPGAGIAQKEAEALAPTLRRIRDETGCALVVIEHDMPLIRAVSERLVALEAGSVLAQGAPEAVLRDPAVVAAYLGTDERTINRSGVRVGAR